ncbi:MAG: undecaprenol kinase, undecaprenyl-diphosphatase [Candidatus Parcubacteria bacterium]|jgi:undecaprenyl-diphosphatase
MNLFYVTILAVVEGITEFLPVSSTFHLILTSHILGLSQSDFWKLFEVFVQSGAILSVLIISWKALWQDRKLMKNVIISFLPTAVIGFAFYKIIKGIFFQANLLMAFVFLVVGVAFFVTEQMVKSDQLVLKKQLKSLTIWEAVLIGLVQALAVVPGVSRAGSVILGMMFMQYRRDESAKYSFYLSIPTIFAASAYDLLKMRHLIASNPDYITYLVFGFVVAFATSYIVVKWLLGYLKSHTLEVFAWYRIGLFALLVVLTATNIFKFL